MKDLKRPFEPIEVTETPSKNPSTTLYIMEGQETLADLGLPAQATPWGQLSPGAFALPLGGIEPFSYVAMLPSKKPLLEPGAPMGSWHQSQWLGAQVALRILSDSHFPHDKPIALRPSQAVASLIRACPEGFVCGLFVKMHKLNEDKLVSHAKRLFVEPGLISQPAIARGHTLAQSVLLARRLVNAPPNLLNPSTYSGLVHDLVNHWNTLIPHKGAIRLRTWTAPELAQEGCHLLLAVGQGSAVEPCLVELTYEAPSDSNGDPLHVALVGKGITFDSGGLDIKTNNFMRNMKKDMGGSAAVLGAFHSLVMDGFSGKVSCFLALAENMPSDRSMRPGDVYQSRKGLMVEIADTDAEGRLVLADALDMALERKPHVVLDVATLTGAARVALGGGVDSLFTNNKALRDIIEKMALHTGDWVWSLPLCPEYDKQLESPVADVSNCAPSGHGGAITAALFLNKFVGTTPWAHLDSYMWSDKAPDFYSESGPTGKCVILIHHVVKAMQTEGLKF